MAEVPQSPSSLNDFLAEHSDLDKQTAEGAYYDSLEQYRDNLATYYGVSREDLHAMRFTRSASAVIEIAAQRSSDDLIAS